MALETQQASIISISQEKPHRFSLIIFTIQKNICGENGIFATSKKASLAFLGVAKVLFPYMWLLTQMFQHLHC